MGDRGRKLPHGRDAIGVRERLSFFLRSPALGHVHQCPDEFDHIAGGGDNRVANDMDLSDLAARMHNSIVVVEIRLSPDCFPKTFSSSGPIIGMDTSLEFFKSRWSPCGIETRYAEYFFGPVGMFADRRDTCPTARVAKPLRFRQIGFAASQLGGSFRHLRLEFVAGFTKLLLALAYRFLGAAVSVEEACRPECRCGMIRSYGEQQLVDFGRKLSAITGRRNQTALSSDADGDDDTAASLRAITNVANDFPARQASIDGEMIPQPLRKCLPCASPRDFDGHVSAGIAQTHKSKVEVQ